MRTNVALHITLFFVLLGIFLGLAFVADHLFLPHLVTSTPKQGLLFPPGSDFPYQTPEFSHSAKINSLGFRDREWKIRKKESTTRIVAIGDSFTFGMGVKLDQTWTKVLEHKLRARGFNVEIANLGRPGADPASYVETAKKAIPILKPDLVLVSILQGDDLAQTIRQIQAEQTAKKNTLSNRIGLRFRQTAQYLYPNFSRILREHLSNRSTFKSKERLLENIWKDQAEQLAAGYKNEKKARFDSMGATAKDMFLKGHLNPGIVSMAISNPQYFATPLKIKDPIVKSALKKMQEHLLNIKKAAGDSEVIVLSIPLGVYVSENVWQGRNEIGFTTLPGMLLTSKPDESLKKICDEADITFLSVTKTFRQQSKNEPLYYKYDGHFNVRGHEAFADLLFPWLEQRIFQGDSGLLSTLNDL